MILRMKNGGRQWKWVEKGNRACLIVDDTKVVWWGDPGSPYDRVPAGAAPLPVLLQFSIERDSKASP
jgi:hypothetical protein